jgi:hypothetical protein
MTEENIRISRDLRTIDTAATTLADRAKPLTHPTISSEYNITQPHSLICRICLAESAKGSTEPSTEISVQWMSINRAKELACAAFLLSKPRHTRSSVGPRVFSSITFRHSRHYRPCTFSRLCSGIWLATRSNQNMTG